MTFSLNVLINVLWEENWFEVLKINSSLGDLHHNPTSWAVLQWTGRTFAFSSLRTAAPRPLLSDVRTAPTLWEFTVQTWRFLCLCVVDCVSVKMILHFRQYICWPLPPDIILSFLSTCKYFSILWHQDQSQRQLALFFSFGMKRNEDEAVCCSNFCLPNIESWCENGEIRSLKRRKDFCDSPSAHCREK